MDNRILLISSGSTFMINAITKNLSKVGIEVIKSEPRINDLEEYRKEPDIFLFYLGAYVEDIPDVLVYIKDICFENDKLLCLIGDETEYEIIEKSIPMDRVAEKFIRPLDIKVLVERMLDICSFNDKMARRQSILLVDDDPTFLKLAKSWLDEEYRVTIVNSGVQAITYLAMNKPDLILLDYEMPVTPGTQILEMMKSEVTTKDIPVIFLTGKGDKESVMKAVSLKPNGYLLKTMPKAQILDEIRNFLVGRKNDTVTY